jgi:uncharacterized OB-fold protein
MIDLGSLQFLPRIRPYNEPFWTRLREEGVFTIQQCAKCGERQFPPRLVCPKCGSREFTFEPLTGTATVYAFSRVMRAPAGYDVPRTLALVDLDEGFRVFTEIVGGNPVRCGDRVRLKPVPVDEMVTLYKFEPI